MSLERLTDERIAQLARDKKKSERCFSELYKRHYEGLRNFSMKKGMSFCDAEDNAIISLTKAFEYIKSYNPDKKFSTWLYTIANNKIKDSYKRKTSKKRIPFDKILYGEKVFGLPIEDSDDFNEGDDFYNEKSKLKDAVEKLPERYKKIVEKRIYEDKNFKEISRELNIDENKCTARAMFFRGKGMIKKEINSKLL